MTDSMWTCWMKYFWKLEMFFFFTWCSIEVIGQSKSSIGAFPYLISKSAVFITLYLLSQKTLKNILSIFSTALHVSVTFWKCFHFLVELLHNHRFTSLLLWCMVLSWCIFLSLTTRFDFSMLEYMTICFDVSNMSLRHHKSGVCYC